MREIVRALRLTTEAARRLRQSRGGRVDSVFPHTVNVELDGLGNAGWVSVHGPGAIPAPFGIATERWPALANLEEASVRVDRGALVIDGRLQVTLDVATLSDSTLPLEASLPSVSGCLTRALATVRDGLLPPAAALLAGTDCRADSLAQVAGPALAQLSAATSACDVAGCLTAARELLGLGPGSTPAGDDCVGGWLVGAWTAGAAGRRLVEATGPGLLALAADRTGRLSRAFLAAAVAGQAAEPVRDFVVSPDEMRLAHLIALGGTSGADLLAGYLLARAALASRVAEG